MPQKAGHDGLPFDRARSKTRIDSVEKNPFPCVGRIPVTGNNRLRKKEKQKKGGK
jgi:hypothetical protein